MLPGEALLQAIHTLRNLFLSILLQLLLPAINTCRNPFLGILVKLCCRLNVHTGTYFRASMVQICCRLNMHTGNFSGVSLCSSAAGYTYTQKPTLGFPGEALFQTTHTLRNLLSGISNCSSAASKILLQLCCQLDPNEDLMLV